MSGCGSGAEASRVNAIRQCQSSKTCWTWLESCPQTAPSPTAIDLLFVVRGASEVVQPAADAKRINIAADFDAGLGWYSVMPPTTAGRLGSLTNAVKFTPRDGAVHLRTRRNGSMAEIAVSDKGRGISPDFLPFVFLLFCRWTNQLPGLPRDLALVCRSSSISLRRMAAPLRSRAQAKVTERHSLSVAYGRDAATAVRGRIR